MKFKIRLLDNSKKISRADLSPIPQSAHNPLDATRACPLLGPTARLCLETCLVSQRDLPRAVHAVRVFDALRASEDNFLVQDAATALAGRG